MKLKTFLFSIALFFTSNSYAADFTLNSTDIKAGQTIHERHVFNGFGCSGKNISPQLSWKNAPEGTKSFAITAYDPDAPTGSGWWHWVVVNIPATATTFASNFGSRNNFALADGVNQVRNDFGVYNFGGPCPPKGDKPHRYFFTVYALNVEKIDVKQTATAALAGFMINQHVLGQASIQAFYAR